MINIILFARSQTTYYICRLLIFYVITSTAIPKAHKGLTSNLFTFTCFSSNLINRLNIYDVKSDKKDLYIKRKNISALNQANYTINKSTKSQNYVLKAKHFNPANKEWFNSIYVYNKDITKTLPYISKNLSRFIKSYFNLYSNKLRNLVKKHKSRRFELKRARQAVKKILVSEPESKHTNNRIIITLYIYNTEKLYFLNKISKTAASYAFRTHLIKKLNKLALVLNSKFQNHINTFYSMKSYNAGLEGLNKNISQYKFITYQENYIKNFLRRFSHKQIISIYFKQLLGFNKSKFDRKYISVLANYLKKFYNKNVEFNFVNLKYLYLDSTIFTNTLATKIKRLSRRKKSFMIAIKKSLNMFDIPKLKAHDVLNDMHNKGTIIQNLDISSAIPKIYDSNNSVNLLKEIVDIRTASSDLSNYDILDKSLGSVKSLFINASKFSLSNKINSLSSLNVCTNLEQTFKSTKHKFLNGVRLEIAGRLTRRSGAARSIFKIRNKGNIRDKDSSDKGLSTILLRGYSKSNLRYSKLHSKVRGGSFGIKGWVSSN